MSKLQYLWNSINFHLLCNSAHLHNVFFPRKQLNNFIISACIVSMLWIVVLRNAEQEMYIQPHSPHSIYYWWPTSLTLCCGNGTNSLRHSNAWQRIFYLLEKLPGNSRAKNEDLFNTKQVLYLSFFHFGLVHPWDANTITTCIGKQCVHCWIQELQKCSKTVSAP